MREPRPTDFVVPVDSIGTFTFAKRSLRDEFRINAEYKRLTEGIPTSPDDFMDLMAGAVSALAVLTVQAPEGWDLDALDPFDPESYGKIMKVWGALRGKERTFQGAGAGVSGGGEGSV